MTALDFSLLESLPEGVILIEEGRVAAVNACGRELLPGLTPGEPLPEPLRPALTAPGGGVFHAHGRELQFAASGTPDRLLLFFSPLPEQELEFLQGMARQLRQAAAPLAAELAPHLGPEGDGLLSGSSGKSLHSLLRLAYNAEFLADPTVMPNPVTVDLVSLCSRLVLDVQPLLNEIRVELRFTCPIPALMISGDPILLRRMLLELLANSARVSAPGGQVLLELVRQNRQAILTIRDGGSPGAHQKLMNAMGGRLGSGIPAPGQGAQMGLAVARRIAALHRGALMVLGEPAPCTLLALPAGVPRSSVSMHTPAGFPEEGFSPLLLALCDLMPPRVFEDIDLT